MYRLLGVIFLLIVFNHSYTQVIPKLEWSNSVGGFLDDQGYSIKTDSDNNIYVVGSFKDTVDFDPGPGTMYLTATNNAYEIFILKFSQSGVLKWAKKFDGNNTDYVNEIAIDKNDNLYVVGEFHGSIDMDPDTSSYILTSTLQSSTDGYITKLDSSGKFIWSKQYTGTNLKGLNSVTTDQLGNVYISGWYDGTVDFDPGPGTYNLTAPNAYDCFVTKLDSNGDFKWVRSIVGPDYIVGESICVDNQSNVYTCGHFIGTANFDPSQSNFSITSGGWYDAFVIKHDSSGNFLWAKHFTGQGEVRNFAMDISENSDLYVAGIFDLVTDFDPSINNYNLNSGSSSDIYVACLDSLGSFKWAKQFESTNQIEINAICLDSNNNVYTTGGFSGQIDLNPDTSQSHIFNTGFYKDIFISKLDSNGDFMWGSQLGGGNGLDVGRSIHVDRFSNIYITGCFEYVADFDPSIFDHNHISNGQRDVFITKLAQCHSSSNTLNDTVCDSYLSPSGYFLWNSSGIYMDVLPNSVGCDSILTINLTVNNVDTSVTINSNQLISNATNSNYQWLDCLNSMDSIPNQTNQSFLPSSAGAYAVLVSQNGCVDTSSCYFFSPVNIESVNQLSLMEVYPNPFKSDLKISLYDYKGYLKLNLINMLGVNVLYEEYFYEAPIELKIEVAKGIYFLEIQIENNNSKIYKIIKQ